MKGRERLKILVHQPRLSYYVGGGELLPMAQAGILSTFEHKIEVLTSFPPKFSPAFDSFKKRNPQISIHFLKLPSNQQSIYKEVAGKDWSRWDKEAIFFGQLSSEFYHSNKGRWDLVITHLLSDSLFIPKNFYNILRLHGVPSEKRNFDQIFLQRPDALIPDSKFVREGWRNLYPLLKRERMPVCYNGIDTERFVNLHKERDIDLLYTGRFLKIKGIYNILEALSFLKRKGVEFNKLLMVGDGPEEANMKDDVRRLGLVEKVQIIRSVSQEELVKLYNRAKIFLGPSYAKEGVITTMLEAASCGAAVITARACGMVEFAKHKSNALVIEPKNSNQLVEYIALLLKRPDLRRKLAEKARKDLVSKWDIIKTGKKLERVYLHYAKKGNV